MTDLRNLAGLITQSLIDCKSIDINSKSEISEQSKLVRISDYDFLAKLSNVGDGEVSIFVTNKNDSGELSSFVFWLERNTGKYIQGSKDSDIRCQIIKPTLKEVMKSLPRITPDSFNLTGRFMT